jgi:hypothetical protein
MDSLSEEEIGKIQIKSFKITYQHEALAGDEIEVYRSEMVDGMIYFKGQASDGNHYFEAYLDTVEI